MKILHLDAGRQMRGGQWQALRLAQGLAAQGVESTLLARDGSPLFEAARCAGCRVKPLSLARIAALARQHDVVHAHDSRTHALAAIAGGAPLVVSRRVAFTPSASAAGSVLSRWKYGRAARFIAVSNFVKKRLVERGVPAAKIAVVYDGVPLLDRAQPEGVCVLAPANEADPRKGAALAMEAARLAGVELQFTSALERDLARASTFVYITHSEGLGSGALLAMSAGVPVIASALGGLPEAIRNRENGMLVENNAAAIAAAIRELLDDASLARRLGEAGRRTIEERFSTGQMTGRTLEVYRKTLSE
jgi:glycosyltransferase involved in cell wall biosynthesis